MMKKMQHSKVLLSPDEEADLIANLLADQDPEIAAYSRRMLELHYIRLNELHQNEALQNPIAKAVDDQRMQKAVEL